jgi:hypothetical protein
MSHWTEKLIDFYKIKVLNLSVICSFKVSATVYSKLSLIRINDAKIPLKDKLRTQIHGKFNDISNSDEN